MKLRHRVLSGRLGAVLILAGLVFAVASTAQEPKAMKKIDPAEEKEKMEKEKMEAVKVGDPAPDFVLTDTEGKEHHLSDYTKEKKAVVLEWFNPDCPFVKKHHEKTRSMAETFKHASEHEVVWLAINSGAPGNQGAGVKRNQEAIKSYEIAYPVLIDESGKVGRMYGAKTTPHMFVIDEKGTLIYTGAIDNVPNPNPEELGDINYVSQALDEHAAGKKIQVQETKSYGCGVKYGS